MTTKRILFFSRNAARYHHFLEAARSLVDHDSVHWQDHALDFVWERDAESAKARLREQYVHLLLIDLCGNDTAETEASIEAGLSLVDALDHTEDVEARYGFHRILALVGGPTPSRIDHALVELGRRGVTHVIRGEPDREAVVAARDVLERIVELIEARRQGKVAVCAAGGGVTGIYFELGALKCLDDCMGPGSVNRFESYFGISAGAVVVSCLASGYSVDDLLLAIAGAPGGRIPPLDFSLLRLVHFNHRELAHRVRHAAGALGRTAMRMARGKDRFSLSAVLLEYTDMVGPPFHANAFGTILKGILETAPAGNDFRRLPVELFIGATDQDSRTHVLFGSDEHNRVPISTAVQASMSINPAFTSVPIEGRYYEDGAVTRTSNFTEAIKRDATLVFVLDPFVPYVGRMAGEVRTHGMLYNLDQDIRTVSFTRFTNTRDWALRQHPDVSSYTFVPANRLRRILSHNPMDHRPYLEIWRGAYLSTLQRVERLAHRMRGDLAVHKMHLKLERAQAVAERLEHVEQPQLEDFFPDGKLPTGIEPLSPASTRAPLSPPSHADVS